MVSNFPDFIVDSPWLYVYIWTESISISPVLYVNIVLYIFVLVYEGVMDFCNLSRMVAI